jgi:hypothetical protein
MSLPEDSSASEAKPEATATPGDSAKSETPNTDAKSEAPIDAPKIEAKVEASSEPEAAATEPHRIAYLQPYLPNAYAKKPYEPDDDDAAGASEESPWGMVRRYLPLAACLAIATALGAVAGVAASASLKSDQPAPVAVASTKTDALHDQMARLQGELSTLRASIVAAQRSTGGQIGKLSERVERAEKAQAEPNAKLAKLIESVDKLEHRVPQPQAAAHPVHGVLPSPDITGSVAAKPEPKPVVVDGWRLIDVYNNRALVETRSGRQFEVMVGANLPALGRVDAIRRDGVVTRNGIIAAVAEPRRRMPYYYPD